MGTIRSQVTAAMLTLATALLSVAVVLVAAPAQAGWTHASGVTIIHVCRAATPSGNGWVLRARVKKSAHTPDARAGMTIYQGGAAQRRWSSGWLGGGEVERGEVPTPRARRIRLHVWQEAGDLDSPVGTARQDAVYRPGQIKHC